MKKTKPKIYTTSEKVICDCADKKNYLIRYRMLNFYVRHGIVIDEVYEIISFRQSKWLQKYNSFNTQKRTRAKNDFEKDFFLLLVNAAFGKMMEKIRNRIKIGLIKISI